MEVSDPRSVDEDFWFGEIKAVGGEDAVTQYELGYIVERRVERGRAEHAAQRCELPNVLYNQIDLEHLVQRAFRQDYRLEVPKADLGKVPADAVQRQPLQHHIIVGHFEVIPSPLNRNRVNPVAGAEETFPYRQSRSIAKRHVETIAKRWKPQSIIESIILRKKFICHSVIIQFG